MIEPVRFRVHYADGSVRGGRTRRGWLRMPNDGVQAVAEFGCGHNSTCRDDGSLVDDRKLWTGDDEYDPFGWGPKYGSLIPDDEYWRIWREACDGHR